MDARRLSPFLAMALCLLVSCAPRVPADALTDVEAISGGDDLTCARRRDASTWCWGSDALTSDILERKYARQALPPNIAAASKTSGQTCALFSDRTAACTDATFGRGDPTWPTAWSETLSSSWRKPRVLRRVPIGEVAAIGVGTYIDCARGVNGEAWCWGDYAEVLQTGSYDRTRRSGASLPGASRPALVTGIPPIADMSVGESSALAVGRDGSAWIVGGLARGIKRIAGIDDATQAASGDSFHCIRRATGAVSCFRDGFAINALARLPTTPTPVEGLATAKFIAAGDYAACAIDGADHVFCWGDHPPNASKRTERSNGWQRAERVSGVEGARSLVLGTAHACALVAGGHVLCWGIDSRIGIGVDENLDGRPGYSSGYVRTGASNDPAASLKQRMVVVAVLVVASIALLLALARRVGRRSENAWRLVPPAAASLVAGTGYRASEVTSTREGAPKSVRAALFVGLASVGADVAYVAMFGFYAATAGALGLRQLPRNTLSGAMNLLTAALVVVVVVWLALVATTVIGAAYARKPALGRLRVIGVLGILGHALLALFAFGGRRDVAYLVDRHVSYEAREGALPLVALMLFASALGVVASALMVAAARHRKDLM